MARKEKEPTELDVLKEHALQLPVWTRAVASMAIDRVNLSELNIKLAKDEKLADKYPLFYTSLENQIAMHISAANKRVKT